MIDLDIQLKSLQEKIHLLLKRNQALQKENAALKQEMEKHQALLKEKNELVNDLQQKVDLLKLDVSSMDDEEKKQLEKRIDGYLSEIEKCLALLNA